MAAAAPTGRSGKQKGACLVADHCAPRPLTTSFQDLKYQLDVNYNYIINNRINSL